MLKTLLIIPPFTQVNTPYPSTAHLAGFLLSKGYPARNFDLSLYVFLKIFSKEGLERIFAEIEKIRTSDEFVERALTLKDVYINIIEPVINFLQGKNPNLAYRIIGEGYLPQGESFTRHTDERQAFGYFGLQDKAKYYASLVIDDLSEIIRKTITPHFGLSRYAEKISISPPSFDPIKMEIERPLNLIEKIIVEETHKIVNDYKPGLIGYTIPFPGNLLGTLISSKYIKENFPEIKIVIGGGYINTELRSLKDKEIFKYADFITFDDGELPLYNIVKNIEDKNRHQFVRTFTLINNKLEYIDSPEHGELKYINHNDLFPPSINGLIPNDYVAITEMLNPMHRLWSDGYWNKLMIAHGCYWSKCTFCDVTLDYIGRYSPANAKTIVDWMENLISQTGKTSFHFTDEAAPPAVLKELSLEILKRKLPVSWWGNIRFEKTFSRNLCRLMSAAGCIAVSGGLEVADKRLLKLINKGVTIEQVANVCNNFKNSGIMVHSYLMYGFPSQTEQELMNSLELVRQFIQLDLFQSGFWHLFTLTAHSPAAQNTEKFKVKILSTIDNPFANDNLAHYDETGINYEYYTEGLKKALYNFMHGIGLDWDVRKWFDFEAPAPNVDKNFIKDCLQNVQSGENNQSQVNRDEFSRQVIWIGSSPRLKKNKSASKQLNSNGYNLSLHTNSIHAEWNVSKNIGEWIVNIARSCNIDSGKKILFYELKENFPGDENQFNDFLNSGLWNELRETALLLI